jgi:5-methylcytosine-specific restriction enzyme A
MWDRIANLFGLSQVCGEPMPVSMPAPVEGRSGHWPKVRAEHLEREPACAACGTQDHVQVHHVLPVSWPGGLYHECDAANLVTLCASPGHNCHLWIGHLGDFKSRNTMVRADAAAMLAKVKGRQYPPA